MATRKKAAKPRKKRGPRISPEKRAKAVELLAYWRETEALRHG